MQKARETLKAVLRAVSYTEGYAVDARLGLEGHARRVGSSMHKSNFKRDTKPFLSGRRGQTSVFIREFAQLRKDPRPLAHRLAKAMELHGRALAGEDPEERFAWWWTAIEVLADKSKSMADDFAHYAAWHAMRREPRGKTPGERLARAERVVRAFHRAHHDMKSIQSDVRNSGIVHREEHVELRKPLLVPASEQARRFVEVGIECCWVMSERGGVTTVRHVTAAIDELCLSEIGTRAAG
jgi:hypothetical protein